MEKGLNQNLLIKYQKLLNSNFILEGLVAAGKSTLGKSLEVYLEKKLGIDKCKYYPEFFNDKLFDLYINDKKNNAYSFQIIMIRERHRIFERAERISIGILDRAIFGDLVFACSQYLAKFISEEQFEAYIELAKPDFEINKKLYLIYLECDPKTCYNRNIKRGRTSEQKYTIEDFIKWKKYYDMIIDYVDTKISLSLLNNNDVEIFQKIIKVLDWYPKPKVIRINYDLDIGNKIENDFISDDLIENMLNFIDEFL